MDEYAADWLALRAPYDEAARDRGLMAAFAAALPSAPTILDLGCGTGASPRALAPFLADDARWIGVDADPRLLSRYPGETQRADLSRPDWSALLGGVDAIACTAFIDLVTADWLAGLAAAVGARPVWCAGAVDGRRDWSPPNPDDGLIAAAFKADQRRDKGFGAALGAEAPAAFAHTFPVVRMAPADWRVGPTDRAMLETLIEGEAEAAARHAPAERVRAWAARRNRAAAESALTVRIGHIDSLAFSG